MKVALFFFLTAAVIFGFCSVLNAGARQVVFSYLKEWMFPILLALVLTGALLVSVLNFNLKVL